MREVAVRTIALIAHDNMKPELVEWAQHNVDLLRRHTLFGTGTTGGLVERETGLTVHRYLSGPLGGDQQIGAAIAEGRIDVVIFFWDPLEAQPHDPDVKALLRIATLYNAAIAVNKTSADLIVTSPHFEDPELPSRSAGQ